MAEVTAYLEQRFSEDPTVVTDPGHLAVKPPAPRSIASVHTPREYRARLQFGAWRRRMPVSVEVAPWSDDQCELVVRPSRRPPVPGNAYYGAAMAAVDALAAEVSVATAFAIGTAEVPDAARLRRAS